MIHPQISYGLLAWGNATPSKLKHTEILQKRAIRLINGAEYNSHTEPLFRRSNILKIKDQYQYEVVPFMFKYHLKILPVSFDGMFRHNLNIQIEQNTRQHNRLFIERCDPVFASRLPRYNFPKIWNNLNKNPDNLSLNKFKREYVNYTKFLC